MYGWTRVICANPTAMWCAMDPPKALVGAFLMPDSSFSNPGRLLSDTVMNYLESTTLHLSSLIFPAAYHFCSLWPGPVTGQ
jgi:hypothetical protein